MVSNYHESNWLHKINFISCPNCCFRVTGMNFYSCTVCCFRVTGMYFYSCTVCCFRVTGMNFNYCTVYCFRVTGINSISCSVYCFRVTGINSISCSVYCFRVTGMNFISCSVQGYNLPEVSSSVDAGRMRMRSMMAQKKEHWRYIASCRDDGSCPEELMDPSGGPAPCINGKYIRPKYYFTKATVRQSVSICWTVLAGEAGPIDGKTFPCSNIDLAYFLDFQDLSGGEA